MPLVILLLLFHFCHISAFFTKYGPINEFKSSALNWSCAVAVDCETTTPSGAINNASTITTAHTTTHDMKTPREWLESCEMESGNGAYTVMRCDYDLRKNEFKLWGEDFHLDRLQSSIAAIITTSSDFTDSNSRTTSDATISFLLREAEKQCHEKISTPTEEGAFLCTFMVTLLWQPRRNNNNDVWVRGHVFSSLIPVRRISSSPDLLTVLSVRDDNAQLPNRFQNFPNAKLISWCRQRRPLEETYKCNNRIGEVILTRTTKNNHEVEILEGLTTNFFALYPNNVLRTSDTDHVLGGYARHLVIEAAKRCGLAVEIGPIHLSESELWQEVFLTSSIRIIAPVGEMLLSDSESTIDSLDDSMDSIIWRHDGIGSENHREPLVWKRILDEIHKYKAI